MTSIVDRRGIYIRVGKESNLIGHQSISLGNGGTLWFNKDPESAPKLMEVLADHAAAHDGKLLFPFNYQVAFRSISVATWLIIHGPDDDYLIGRIRESGENYVRGMDDGDGYTVPKEIGFRTARHWVKVSDVQHREHFPADQWRITREYAYRPTTDTLLSKSKATTSCLVVTHI